MAQSYNPSTQEAEAGGLAGVKGEIQLSSVISSLSFQLPVLLPQALTTTLGPNTQA